MDTNDNQVQRTSLQPYLDMFGKYVNKLVKQELSSQKRDREEDIKSSIDFWMPNSAVLHDQAHIYICIFTNKNNTYLSILPETKQ